MVDVIEERCMQEERRDRQIKVRGEAELACPVGQPAGEERLAAAVFPPHGLEDRPSALDRQQLLQPDPLFGCDVLAIAQARASGRS